MDCRHCNTRLREGASFCHMCGAGVDPATPGATTKVQPAEAAPAGDTDPNLTQVTRDTNSRACGRCGATNHDRRLLCGRCGADLHTGEPGRQPGPRLEEPGEATLVDEAGSSETSRRMLAGVVGSAVVAGGVIGALVMSGLPGGRQLPRPPAFDQPPQLLVTHRTVASSTAQGQATSGLIADRDITTAWRAASGNASGEILELSLARPAWIRELQFAVGDQGPQDSFRALARPTRVRVHFGEQEPVVVELADQRGVQSVQLDPSRRASELRIEIVETTGGTHQDTVAVSEVALRGHPVHGADG